MRSGGIVRAPSPAEGRATDRYIKILIADDHAVLRSGLKAILERQFPGAECGEARNADEVLAQVRKQPWDIVILDITMPGRSGLDILADLKGMRPDVPVLILSMHSDEEYGTRVLRRAP